MSYKNCIICLCDLHTLALIIFQDGKKQIGKFHNEELLINYCINHAEEFNHIIFLGNPNKTTQTKEFLKLNHITNVYSYDTSAKHNSSSSDNLQASIETILNTVYDIKNTLKEEQPKNSSLLSINTSSAPKDLKELRIMVESMSETIGKVERQSDYLIGCMDTGTSSENNSMVEDLRNELNAYKNDFYYKSMQRYGVNISIEILDRLYNEKHYLERDHAADNMALKNIKKIIAFCETKIKKLNIQTETSNEGDNFDCNTMVSYDDIVMTNDKELRGRIAYSISPAYYWTLPRVNAPGEDKLLIKEETVALYE